MKSELSPRHITEYERVDNTDPVTHADKRIIRSGVWGGMACLAVPKRGRTTGLPADDHATVWRGSALCGTRSACGKS